MNMVFALALPSIIALLVAILWQVARLARGFDELLAELETEGDTDAPN